MNIDNSKAQMKKGVLEMCILALLKEGPAYVSEIIEELKTGKFADIAERSGRAQDKEGGGGLEALRRSGYM